MSTLIPQSVLFNSTLLNITTTTTEPNFGNIIHNTTLYAIYNSSNGSSSHWDPYYNITSWNIFCSDCYSEYVTDQTPLVPYTYTYIYYALLLLLLIIAIICIKLGISRKNMAQSRAAAARRRAARQQVVSPYGSTNNCNNSNNDDICHMGPKELDAPPAYDEVMQSYIMAKQQNGSNEGALGFTTATPSSAPANNLSNAVSTLTIETEIANSNHARAIDLNNPATSTIATAATTVTTAAVVNTPPPSYEYSIEMSNTKLNNGHIV